MLVGPFRRRPLIEPKTDDVGDNTPAALGRHIYQIIPALCHGGPAIAAVAVEVNFRSFEFDNRQRLGVLALPEDAEDRVGGFATDGRMLHSVPDFLAVERSGVAQRIAKNLR